MGKKLEKLGRCTGKSINGLVFELLKSALGVRGRRARLKSYVAWSEDDVREFGEALEPQRQVDEALWR